MFLVVKDVLSAAEIGQLTQIAAALRFVDGRVSNPHNETKKNLQVDSSDPEANRAAQIAAAAIMRNDELRNFIFLKRMTAPLLCRYEAGLGYGVHADAAYMPFPELEVLTR